MAVRLVSMRNMPEDEIEEIRSLLDENNIGWYDTPPGLMGLNPPTFWLRQADDLPRAKTLLQRYNQQRSERIRAEHQRLRENGELPTFWQSVQQQPLRFVSYLAFILFLVYVTLGPFWGWL